MQIQDFVKAYEGKPDEELVQLAAAPGVAVSDKVWNKQDA